MATLLNKEVTVKSNSGSNAYKFKLVVTENSTNIANNTSNITVNYYAAMLPGWGFSGYSAPHAVIKVGGAEKASAQISSINSTSYKLLTTWTGNVTHDADGKKVVNVSGIWKDSATSYLPVPNTISENITLSTIPRTSSFSANNTEIEGICNISINRAAAFTHTLNYQFGSLSGTIATNVTTSYSWTIPTSFYNQIPNSKSGTCTITCITYSGSTEIGRVSKNITISCNEEKCRPSVDMTIVDSNNNTVSLTGNNQTLIRYKSNALITPIASSKNGALISRITINDIMTNGTLTINEVSTNSFIIIVTDSRGFTNTLAKVVGMYEYVPLTCNAVFKRLSQTSNTINLDCSGNYFNDSFGNINNTLNMSWKYREKGATSWTIGGNITPTITNNTYNATVSCGTDFDYRKDYEFIIYFNDKLDNLNTGSLQVLKGLGAFEIYQDGIKLNGTFIGIEVVDEW